MCPRSQQLHLNSRRAHSRTTDHFIYRSHEAGRPQAPARAEGTQTVLGEAPGGPKGRSRGWAARFTHLASFLLCPELEPRFSGSKHVRRGGEATRPRREAEAAAFPGRGAQARGAAVRSPPRVPATSGWRSEMASQPPCAPSAPEAPDEGKETVSHLCKEQLPLVPSGDIEHLSPKLPYAALVRAYGRFKLSIADARQSQLLPPFDPLKVDKGSLPPKKHPVPEKKFWGSQESLSKVRPPGAGARNTGLTLTRGEGTVSRLRDPWGPTRLSQGP